MESKQKFRPDPRLKLMDLVRQVLRYHDCAYCIERAYCDWIIRYIKFHGAKKHSGIGSKRHFSQGLDYLLPTPIHTIFQTQITAYSNS